VTSREEVDRIHRAAIDLKDKYKINQILEPCLAHGVYSFYFEDLDHNWWEILFYDGFQHDDAFDFGDRFPMEDNAPVADVTEKQS
jgi:predicted lactoylglutathione lyase